jgi:hypothetical protein
MIIGGVTLDHDLTWDDEFDFTKGAGVAERTIFGTMVSQSFPLKGGQNMTLTGDQNHGWQKRSTVTALMALANTVGSTYAVTMPDNRVYTVEFRHEEAPSVSFKPIVRVSDPTSDFWYYGEIKLRIVA